MCFVRSKKLLLISKEVQLIQDYLPFYVTICKQIKGNYYFITVCVGCRKEKVLSRLYELRNELAVYLHDRKPDWEKLFHDEQWLAWLAYLTDIFIIQHSNGLNTSM